MAGPVGTICGRRQTVLHAALSISASQIPAPSSIILHLLLCKERAERSREAGCTLRPLGGCAAHMVVVGRGDLVPAPRVFVGIGWNALFPTGGRHNEP